MHIWVSVLLDIPEKLLLCAGNTLEHQLLNTQGALEGRSANGILPCAFVYSSSRAKPMVGASILSIAYLSASIWPKQSLERGECGHLKPCHFVSTMLLLGFIILILVIPGSTESPVRIKEGNELSCGWGV